MTEYPEEKNIKSRVLGILVIFGTEKEKDEIQPLHSNLN